MSFIDLNFQFWPLTFLTFHNLSIFLKMKEINSEENIPKRNILIDQLIGGRWIYDEIDKL